MITKTSPSLSHAPSPGKPLVQPVFSEQNGLVANGTSPTTASSPGLVQTRLLDLLHKRLREAAVAATGGDWFALFQLIDTNHNGALDRTELHDAVRNVLKLNATAMPDSSIQRCFDALDSAETGEIGIEDFIAFLEDGVPAIKPRSNPAKRASPRGTRID